MKDQKARPETAPGPDLLQERMRDPVYAGAYEAYRTMLIERVEAALQTSARRRTLGGRGPGLRRDAVHLQPRRSQREPSRVVQLPED